MAEVELDEYTLEMIKNWVWSGFHTLDEVDELIEDDMEYEEELETLARAAAREEFEKKRAAEASWPAKTDCDRLDAVFEALNAAGIIALHNPATPCRTEWRRFGRRLSSVAMKASRGTAFTSARTWNPSWPATA